MHQLDSIVMETYASSGTLLHQEGTRRSISEAAECLSRSQDIIILEQSSHITTINRLAFL